MIKVERSEVISNDVTSRARKLRYTFKEYRKIKEHSVCAHRE